VITIALETNHDKALLQIYVYFAGVVPNLSHCQITRSYEISAEKGEFLTPTITQETNKRHAYETLRDRARAMAQMRVKKAGFQPDATHATQATQGKCLRII